MQQIRCEMDQDLEEMVASARTMVDWKHYVKTYPWVCLGTAAALGFLIVPKRSRAIHPDLATLTELAKTGHLVVEPAPAATHGLVDALLATVASIAVRKGPNCWGKVPQDYWEERQMHHPSRRWIPMALRIAHPAGLIMFRGHPGKSRHDSNCTS